MDISNENSVQTTYEKEIIPLINRVKQYIETIKPKFNNFYKVQKLDDKKGLYGQLRASKVENFAFFMLMFFENLIMQINPQTKSKRYIMMSEITYYTSPDIQEMSNRFELSKYLTDYQYMLRMKYVSISMHEGNRYTELGLEQELRLFNEYLLSQDYHSEWSEIHEFLDLLQEKRIISFEQSGSLADENFIKKIKQNGIQSCSEFNSTLMHIKVSLNGYITEEIAKHRDTMYMLAEEHKYISDMIKHSFSDVDLKLKGGNCYKLNIEKLHNSSIEEKMKFINNLKARGIKINIPDLFNFFENEYNKNVLSDWDFAIYNDKSFENIKLHELEKQWAVNSKSISNNKLESVSGQLYEDYVKINNAIKNELKQFIEADKKYFDQLSKYMVNLYSFTNKDGISFAIKPISHVKMYHYNTMVSPPPPKERSKILFQTRDIQEWNVHFNHSVPFFEMEPSINNMKIVDLEVYGNRDNKISGFDLIRLELVFQYTIQLKDIGANLVIPVFGELLDYSCVKPFTPHGSIYHDVCDHEYLDFKLGEEIITFKAMSLKLFIDDIFFIGTVLKPKLKKRIGRLCNALLILMGKTSLSENQNCKDTIVDYLRHYNYYCKKYTGHCISELLKNINIEDNQFVDVIKSYVNKYGASSNGDSIISNQGLYQMIFSIFDAIMLMIIIAIVIVLIIILLNEVKPYVI